MSTKIDTSILERAIKQLEKSQKFLHSEIASKNRDFYEQFRTAAIKTFEYTYEITLKTLRRQLEQIVLDPEDLRKMVFMDFIRTAYEAKLVREVPIFKVYRDKRNMTSHTYAEDKAEEVLGILESFLKDARYILKEIKKRNS